MRDVSVIELKKIFFDDDFFSSQIWWELWKTLDVICSHFTASCNKQFFDVRVHLYDQSTDTSYSIMDSKVPYHSHLLIINKETTEYVSVFFLKLRQRLRRTLPQ